MIKVSGRFSGIVHYVQNSTVIASRRNRLYVSRNSGDTWQPLCTIPLPLSLRLRVSTRLTRRLFRAMVHHVTCLEERTMVIIAFGAIYTYDLVRRQLGAETTTLRGSRPLALCKTPEAKLYYGEYRGNPERSPVHILGSENGGRTWRPVYSFSGVRHIHGVYFDPYAKAIWVTTGDDDSEAGIWMTYDHFTTLEKVLAGGQQQRIVQPLFTPDYVYFGTDTPLEANYLYRFRRHDGYVEKLQQVEGSVFYGCQVAERLFFSSVCEPSAVNRSRDVVLWSSQDGASWQPAIRFRKDLWSKKLFQYGQILFPSGQNTHNQLWLTPLATWGEQKSLRLDLSAL